MRRLKHLLTAQVEHSVIQLQNNILQLAEKKPRAKLIDLGCDDGKRTLMLAEQIGTKSVYGMEIVKSRITEAIKKGVKVKAGDLNNPMCNLLL